VFRFNRNVFCYYVGFRWLTDNKPDFFGNRCVRQRSSNNLAVGAIGLSMSED